MRVNIRNTFFNIRYWASKKKADFKKYYKGRFSNSELDEAWSKIKNAESK